MILGPFCGVGWAEALHWLGLREVGIDLDPAICATRMAAGHRATIRADVAAFPLGHLAGRVQGLVASPPCQAFSRAGKRLGIADLPALFAHAAEVLRAGRWLPYPAAGWHDARSPLVLEPLRYALELEPQWVALEQVEDALPLWRAFAHVLGRHGYATWAGILCAADYGVPQTRYRAILMAHRDRPRVDPPAPTHHLHGGMTLFGDDVPRHESMAAALGWDGMLDPRINSELGGGRLVRYERGTDRPSPVVRGNADRWLLRSNTQDHAAMRSLDQPASTIFTGGRRSKDGALVGRQLPPGEGQEVGGWAWRRPATTVQGDPRVPRPGHRDRAGGEHQQDGAVRVTLDELAILQGMPAGYPWQGTKTQISQQIGNLIPPPLAAAIVAALAGIDREAVA